MYQASIDSKWAAVPLDNPSRIRKTIKLFKLSQIINLFLLIKNFKVEKWPLGNSHLGCIRATYASRSQHVCGRMHFQPHFHRCIRVAPVARMRSYAARMQTCANA